MDTRDYFIRRASVMEAATPRLLKEGLQQIHVNLESETGKALKFMMRLPFKKHSQLDPLAAAVQAFRTFQEAPSHFLTSRSQFTEEETGALSFYKGAGYRSLNTALRTDPAALTNEGRQTINTLDALIHSSKAQKEFTVYRGFKHPELSGKESLVGKEFTEHGFASASINPYVSDDFARGEEAFTSEIRMKKGSKGFYYGTNEVWGQKDIEAEFVLPRGTRFKVLEEHAATRTLGPRHLVLEAITPEYAPTPLQLEKQIAHEVRPTVKGAAATAQKMIMKETEHELHVNLESRVGGWLKQLLKIPVKAHSRFDPLAAAGVEQQVSQNTERTFTGINYKGILLGGTLALGAGLVFSGIKKLSEQSDDNKGRSSRQVMPPTPNAPLHGHPEHFSINRTKIESPDGSTNLSIDDDRLNHEQVDKAFRTHLHTSFAHA